MPMPLDQTQVLTLARDASSAGRGRLLALLSRAVLDERDSRPAELALFFDIVRIILPRVGSLERRGFSELAADRTPFPHDLLLSLAHDEIRVAEPVLMRAIGLAEPDLLDIATNRDDGHRLAIAARPVVSARLTGVLVGRGGRAVLRRLIDNLGAELDAEALRELQKRASLDRDLRNGLEQREARTGAANRRATEGAARPALPVLPTIATAVPVTPQRPIDPVVADLIERVRLGATTLRDVVVDLADGDRHTDLACFLGRIADIDESQVMRVLVRADANGIAMLARGLDLDADAFAHVVDLRRRRLRLNTRQARWEREAFDRIDRDEARGLLAGTGGARRSA